jgi:hypothetical protein
MSYCTDCQFSSWPIHLVQSSTSRTLTSAVTCGHIHGFPSVRFLYHLNSHADLLQPFAEAVRARGPWRGNLEQLETIIASSALITLLWLVSAATMATTLSQRWAASPAVLPSTFAAVDEEKPWPKLGNRRRIILS